MSQDTQSSQYIVLNEVVIISSAAVFIFIKKIKRNVRCDIIVLVVAEYGISKFNGDLG